MSNEQSAGEQTNASGVTVPIWYEGVSMPRRGPPEEDLRADVCVVGAGIAGLMTAYLLARAGKSVVVLDEKQVGGGETGRTSAHLSSALDDRFKHLEEMHGKEATGLLHESHVEAIDLIEQLAEEEAINCDFARIDGLLFAGEKETADFLREEYAAAVRAGVRGVEYREEDHAAGCKGGACIRFPEQARFHPLRFLRGLAGACEKLGVRICCGARVMDLSGDGPVVAKLSTGLGVVADFGVAATNVPTPINNWVGIYTKEAAYRTYVIGCEIARGGVEDALYWDTEDPYHYVRVERSGDRSVLLVGGEDHKTGQPGEHDGGERFARLEQWARRWFPAAGAVVTRWSGQVNEPDDGVAFIGRVPTRGNGSCFVITGDSGMGLTHGALGAMLVSDQILGRTNAWEKAL